MPTSSKPPPKHPPPLRPLAVALTLKQLRLVVPVAVIVIVAAILSPGLAVLLLSRGQEQHVGQSVPEPTLAADLQGPALTALATFTTGALPEPSQEQRRPPCDPDFEHEANGACWLPIAIERCPTGRAFIHNGKCYVRSMRQARAPVPTTGDMKPLGVAEP